MSISRNPKVKLCEWCGKEFQDKYRDGKRFCSRSCASFWKGKHDNKRNINGENNPNWRGGLRGNCAICGKEFVGSDRTVLCCSKKCAAAYRKIAYSTSVTVVCKMCGKSFEVKKSHAARRKYCSMECSASDPEKIEVTQRKRKGFVMSEEARKRISVASSIRVEMYSHGKSGFYESVKAGRIFYRSSYELAAYEKLDADVNVVSYQPEPFCLEYQIADSRIRRYRPDILVHYTDKDVLVEVKPTWKFDDPLFVAKMACAQMWATTNGAELQVWTEFTLGKASKNQHLAREAK